MASRGAKFTWFINMPQHLYNCHCCWGYGVWVELYNYRCHQTKKTKKEKIKTQHFFLSFFADPCVFRFGKWSGLPVLYGVAKFYLMGRQTVLDAAYSSASIQALTLARWALSFRLLLWFEKLDGLLHWKWKLGFVCEWFGEEVKSVTVWNGSDVSKEVSA